MVKRDRAEYYKQYYQKNKDKISEKGKNRSKKYREENKNLLSEKGKIYYQKNKEQILKRTAKNKHEKYLKDPQDVTSKNKEWKRTHIEMYLAQGARARAKRDNIPYKITYKDIVVPEKCPYLDIPLVPFSGWCTPSLDKIIPELGYVPGNIQVISKLANTMKNQASIEQLLTFANSVIRIHEKKQH